MKEYEKALTRIEEERETISKMYEEITLHLAIVSNLKEETFEKLQNEKISLQRRLEELKQTKKDIERA